MNRLINSKVIISLLFFLSVICIINVSNAALEIKEGSSAYVNVTIGESFDICYNLRDGTSTLGECELDPHMATCLDIGAVAYLAHSRYGINSSNMSQNSTGNKSGIMEMNIWTRTATLYENRNKTLTNTARIEELILDATKSKYIDIISNNLDNITTRGRALKETDGWYGRSTAYRCSQGTSEPIIVKDGLIDHSLMGEHHGSSGAANGSITFRPIIWN